MHSHLGFPAGALWYRHRQIESRGVALEREAVVEVAQQWRWLLEGQVVAIVEVEPALQH